MGYDQRKVSIQDPAVVLAGDGTRIGVVLTCATDMGIGRVDDRIFSIASDDKPDDFKPRGLCCGFVKIDTEPNYGDPVILKDKVKAMSHTEPPPGYGLDVKQPLNGSKKRQTKQKEGQQIVIKKPQIRDVKEILGLINEYAASGLMLQRGPQYLYENIRDFVIAVDMNICVNTILESKELMHLIVGCGSLHVLWEDVAEVRSLAISHDYQHMKIGRKLIEFMKSEAKQFGIRRLYTFTNSEGFFKSLGFVRQTKGDLPAKIWGECSRCPKFYKCDEIGMMLRL